MKRLQASLFLENLHFLQKSIHSPSTLLMTFGQSLVLSRKDPKASRNLKDIRELIAILILYVFQEVLEGRQLLDLEFNPGMLRLQSPQSCLCLGDLSVFLYDFGFLDLSGFEVLVLACVLSAQEGTESDEVVLDQNILLSQLLLTHSAPLLFLLKFFLLIFEGLLHLVHEAAFLEEACCWAHAVKLQRGWQLDFLILNHLVSTF